MRSASSSAEDHRHHQRRPDQRQRHLEEHPHRVDAVDLAPPRRCPSGTICSAGEDQQRHEGRGLPDVDHHHRPHRGVADPPSRRSAGRSGRARAASSLMMPNWSCSIQPHILAETMVGIAQGISIAARTRPRPVNSAFSTQRDDQAEHRLEQRPRRRENAKRVPDRVPPVAVGEDAGPLSRVIGEVVVEADEACSRRGR